MRSSGNDDHLRPTGQNGYFATPLTLKLTGLRQTKTKNQNQIKIKEITHWWTCGPWLGAGSGSPAGSLRACGSSRRFRPPPGRWSWPQTPCPFPSRCSAEPSSWCLCFGGGATRREDLVRDFAELVACKKIGSKLIMVSSRFGKVKCKLIISFKIWNFFLNMNCSCDGINKKLTYNSLKLQWNKI